jgi:flagellar motor switch protein FliN/FliY
MKNTMSEHGPRAVQFGQLEAATGAAPNPHGIELLKDVSLTVQAELGRTRRQVKDILRLQVGAVLQLEKEAGDPVDILVNDKAIARGKVVEIDGQYGVQITEILK